MNHADHVALIRGGVLGAGLRWLELGAGEGAFTLALAEVVGPGAALLAMDRDAVALEAARDSVRFRFPGAGIQTRVGDFAGGLPNGPFDGVLAANSLHFVRERQSLLRAIRRVFATGRPPRRRRVRHRWWQYLGAPSFFVRSLAV